MTRISMKKKRIYTEKKRTYIRPTAEITDVGAIQVLCASGEGWAEMGDYGTDTGGGFSQPF